MGSKKHLEGSSTLHSEVMIINVLQTLSILTNEIPFGSSKTWGSSNSFASSKSYFHLEIILDEIKQPEITQKQPNLPSQADSSSPPDSLDPEGPPDPPDPPNPLDPQAHRAHQTHQPDKTHKNHKTHQAQQTHITHQPPMTLIMRTSETTENIKYLTTS